MPEDGLENFPAAGEAKLLVEFSGVIEAEDFVGLFGEKFFGLSEESEVRISEEDVFEVGNDAWLGLNECSSWAVLFLALFLEFLGSFGDEEGGGKAGDGGENVMGSEGY